MHYGINELASGLSQPCIGVVPLNAVDCGEALAALSNGMVFRYTGEEGQGISLDRHHTHFIFVENRCACIHNVQVTHLHKHD